MNLRPLRLLMCVLVAACSSGADAPTAPKIVPMTGTWMYSAEVHSFDDGGGTCTVSHLRLDVVQSSYRFNGTSSGGTIFCQYATHSSTQEIPKANVTATLLISDPDSLNAMITISGGVDGFNSIHDGVRAGDTATGSLHSFTYQSTLSGEQVTGMRGTFKMVRVGD